MIVKKVLLNITLVVLFVLVSAMAFVQSEDLHIWFSWWTNGAEPLTAEGTIADVYEYRGRDRGKQRIGFIDIKEGRLGLHAVFDRDTLELAVAPGAVLRVRYYPTPTGSNYIFYMETNHELIYEGKFHRAGWGGVVIFLICIFYLAVIFILLKVFFKNIGRGQ